MTTQDALNKIADATMRAFPVARDQGPRGTCAAFATTAAHERRCGVARPLSEEHAFWLGRQKAPPASEGASVTDVLSGLRRDGHLSGDDWPYGQPPPPTFNVGGALERCPLRDWQQLPDCRFATVQSKLAAGSPVVLSLAFAPAVWFNAGTGWLDYDSTVPVLGAHAVLGVAATQDAPRPAVLVRNSWGTTWGRAGYAWAPAELLDAHGLVAHSLGARSAA